MQEFEAAFLQVLENFVQTDTPRCLLLGSGVGHDSSVIDEEVPVTVFHRDAPTSIEGSSVSCCGLERKAQPGTEIDLNRRGADSRPEVLGRLACVGAMIAHSLLQDALEQLITKRPSVNAEGLVIKRGYL